MLTQKNGADLILAAIYLKDFAKSVRMYEISDALTKLGHDAIRDNTIALMLEHNASRFENLGGAGI